MFKIDDFAQRMCSMQTSRNLLFSALCAMLISFLFIIPCALGESAEDESPAYPPLPVLSDPMDQHMQSLGTIYQKDPRFKKLLYDTTYFSIKGCAPSSIANAVIAAFGVTNADTAAQIVHETLRILCPGQKYGRKPIDQNKLSTLFNPQLMAESAERYPALSTVVGGYPGAIDFSLDRFTAELAANAIENHSGENHMVTGRISVRDSWEEAIRILYMLDDAGMDDAVLILSYAGAGTTSADAPLRTSNAGHYLTLYIHAGMFAESGTVYVLDSLPRAVFGEEYRPGLAYRSCYAFVGEEPDSPFNAAFSVRRISPTIIRIDLNETSLQQIAGAQEAAPQAERAQARIGTHTSLMNRFQVYSTCMAILRFPAE